MDVEKKIGISETELKFDIIILPGQNFCEVSLSCLQTLEIKDRKILKTLRLNYCEY